ncbi:hypothetical protein SAY86_006697 [Trapa natans]|uniref:CBBY-like protein n=1 Tax=Trapa natans TaxID=22666 RepID=A0AAN7L739_TRANT|nr:hypothetical protein SAY86_006697 [Trapa natans]
MLLPVGRNVLCLLSFHLSTVKVPSMETASSSSCSILHGLSNLSSGRLSCRLISRGHFYFRPTVASGSKPLVFPSHSSTLSANLTRRPNGLASQSARVATAFSSLSSEQQPAELGLLLEVEGVLIDAYRLGNRQAFNKAFQKLGLDCANWTQPIYLDLVRKSAGDEKRMLVLFFNRIGWPTSLPTNEKDKFIKSVLQEKKNAMGELMMSKDIPLRPGVEEFIDSACNEDIPVVILTSYGRSEEKVTRAVVEKLGEDRVSKIKVVGTAEVRQSLYGQLVLGNRLASGSDEEIVKEVRGAGNLSYGVVCIYSFVALF